MILKVVIVRLPLKRLLPIFLFSTLSAAQTQTVNATIDTSKTGAPISKYIYGQFLEHIGGIVNDNIWAEMLDDRKFYYPITSHPPAEPAGPSWRRMTVRHWMPIGADEFVVTDSDHPYVGDHTPRVKLDPREVRGNPIWFGRPQRKNIRGPHSFGRRSRHHSPSNSGLGECRQ